MLIFRLPNELVTPILRRLDEKDFRSLCDAFYRDYDAVRRLCILRLNLIVDTSPRILSNPPLTARTALQRSFYRLMFRRTLLFSIGIHLYGRFTGPPDLSDET
jgi:hypothetical protein